jgi:hypothetical protein
VGSITAPEEADVVFIQQTASARWVIVHGLHRYPTVIVVDSGGTVVAGDVAYPNDTAVVLTFSAPFSGTAYLD